MIGKRVGSDQPMKDSAAAATGGIRGRSALFAALLAGVLASPAAAQFSAQPVILELRTDGSGSAATITVRNESDDPLQLRIYAADFDQVEDGSHTFMDAGAHDSSCMERLEVFPGNLVLEARGQDEVRVQMGPGDSTCWSMIFVQNVNRNAAGIQIAQRIGVKVYGVSTGLRADGEVRGITVSAADSAGARAVEVAFANTGAAPVRPDGELEIRSEAGDVVAVVPIRPFSVLPGRVAVTRIPLEVDLEAGRYLLIPVLDFGGDYLAGGQGLLVVEDT